MIEVDIKARILPASAGNPPVPAIDRPIVFLIRSKDLSMMWTEWGTKFIAGQLIEILFRHLEPDKPEDVRRFIGELISGDESELKSFQLPDEVSSELTRRL